jgi:hypothetical protein
MADPFEAGPHYVWQARRYSIAVSSRVSFVVLAYRPAGENAILPKTQRIAVAQPESAPVGRVQIRVVVPWGEGDSNSVGKRARDESATSDGSRARLAGGDSVMAHGPIETHRAPRPRFRRGPCPR